MTREQIMRYPLIGQEELEAALMEGVVQTKLCLPKFAEKFKNIYSVNGFYEEALNNQWTNGFWTGQLWLAYEISGDESFKDAAMVQTESFRFRLDHQIETDTHDLGFLYSPSCVAAYKLTKDSRAKETALQAADLLLKRFHEKGQFIQAWGDISDPGNYRLIIDCLLNLPLLYWASQVTGDHVYEEKARAHAETALNVLIRPDYSTYHTFYFDPKTGNAVKGVTHQGYSADSAWSRGQAWGIYGIALTYRYTKREEYVELFEKVTEYFLQHLPADLIPYWDFTFSDGSLEPRDSSAAAVAVCGMMEMAKYLEKEKAQYYQDCASRLMKALHDHCGVKDPKQSDGVLLHGVYGRKTPYNDCIDHGVDECNLWGDYFYMEALIRMKRDWELYW